MKTILQDIEIYKRAEIARAMQAVPPRELEARLKSAPPPRGFCTAIEKSKREGRHALIAEIKKASPSKGLIRADFNPEQLAMAYERGGATCLSVLTDRPSFQGSLDDLVRARAASKLPVLRKDFLFDPYQVLEARVFGADCILIIMAAVDDATAATLEEEAFRLGMDVLIEVHNEAELSRALHLSSPMIGINNRDLHSFITSLTVTESLSPLIPKDRLLITESGISASADLFRLARSGASGFLVGESLMRQEDVEKATRRLLGLGESAVQGKA